MSGAFGKKKQDGNTVAILDIESGSVGAGLVRISKKNKPKLFGQTRTPLLPRSAPTATALLSEIEKELHKSLVHLSEVAARIRLQSPLAEAGEINRVAVFLHAPWVGLDIAGKKPAIRAHDETLDLFRTQVVDLFETVPVTFHSFSATSTPVVHGLFNAPEEALVCTIGGEVSELSLLRSGLIEGHATMPQGFNTVLRTLQTHAGISRPEALSAISLARSTRELEWAEALAHAIKNMTGDMSEAMKMIKADPAISQRVFVIAPPPAGEWFARMFTEDENLNGLFAPGSTIRPVLSKHAAEHMSGHPPMPDLPLLLESLFVDTRFAA